MYQMVLLLTLALGCLASWGYAADTQAPNRPNIVFIFSDDHAYQAISAYQDPRELIQTPNIDRLAKEGMLFERCLVPNSICGPSRATVLTGKYSHLNGFPNNSNSRFDGNQPTFPKQLQKAGYRTAIIGKWHLESDPTGFDHWQILPGQGVYYHPPMIRNGEKIEEKGYVTDIITQRSLEWLDKRERDKPFLLMIQHKAPHREWSPALRHLNHDHGRTYPEPETLHETYDNRGTAVRDQDMTLASTYNDRDAKLVYPPRLTEEEKKIWDQYYAPRNQFFKDAKLEGKELVRWRYQRYMHDYLGTIQAVDEGVGKVLQYLDDNGLKDNTIVIYASDQGFYLGEHGWFDKRWIFEESLKTPFLVRWPGVVKAGVRNKQLVSTVDFAQTLLDVAHAEPLAETQGASLVPLFKGELPKDWRKSFYYHYYEFPVPHHVRPHYGVVTDRYKLVHFYGPDVDYWELYDREKDPHELRNFYQEVEYQPVVQHLHQELERLRSELRVPDPDPQGFSGNARNRQARKTTQRIALKLDFSKNFTSDELKKEFTLEENFQGAFHGSVQPNENEGDRGARFDGKSWYQLTNDKAIDPSQGPWSVRVRLFAEKTNRAVLTRGGEALGYGIFINDEGQPEGWINLEGVPKRVKSKNNVLDKWATVDLVISGDKKLKLYVNELLEDEVTAGYLTRDPSDIMHIGADLGSKVISDFDLLPFEGVISFVELFNGDRFQKGN